MNREAILPEIIKGYRASIRERYQYQTIVAHYDLPKAIDKETVNGFRKYFLEYLYPDINKRQELEKAFKSLDDYIKYPQKLIQILFDAGKLVFKYGRHLNKILNAGLKALKSFRAASKFEKIFIEEALNNTIEPPYDLKKINRLISGLSRKEIDDFIETTESLFEILHDKKLTQKILGIIEDIIAVMKNKPTYYSLEQIKGLEFGYLALNEGNRLFNTLNNSDQVTVIALITKIERDRLNQIF